MKKLFSTLLVLAVLTAGTSMNVLAAFPEKDIKFIIPYKAGGGFDAYVRAISPVLEKYLPNKVNVIPVNMPGAGSRKGAAAVYRSKPDGYTIGIFNLPGIALPQIKGEKVQYDLRKITWLSQIATDKYGLAVVANSNIKTLADLKALGRPLKFTSTGKSTTMHVVSVIVGDRLNINLKLITGYKGSKNAILGVLRGDGDAVVMISGTLNSFVRSGDLRVLATFSNNTLYPGVPNANNLGAPDLGKLGIVRLIGAAPGMSDDVKKILSDALLKTLNDPGLQAWSKKAKRSIVAADGITATRVLSEQMDVLESYKSLF